MSDARSMAPRLPEAKLLIDGESVAPADGGTVPVTNPATREFFFPAPPPSPADVDKAVHAARRAFESGPWSRMNPSGRAKLIRKLAERLRGRPGGNGPVASPEGGKTIQGTRPR